MRGEKEARELFARLMRSARENTATVYVPDKGKVSLRLPPMETAK